MAGAADTVGAPDAPGAASAAGAALPTCILVQDSGRPGYERIPGWIVEGYSTLFAELDAQLAAAGAGAPDLVAVPVGVGSLAQAAVTHYRSRPDAHDAQAAYEASAAHPTSTSSVAPGGPGAYGPLDGSGAGADVGRGAGTDGGPDGAEGVGPGGPVVLSVEPQAAACVWESLVRQEPAGIETGDTAMAGLNCGTPSSLAWPVLRAGLDAAVAISEAQGARAVRDLGALGVSAGPCGAASLAGVRAALTGEGATDRRTTLAIGPTSTLVLLSTEGTAANPHGERQPDATAATGTADPEGAGGSAAPGLPQS